MNWRRHESKKILSECRTSACTTTHLNGKPQKIVDLALSISDYVLGLDPSIERAPKKYYVAYKIAQNIVCMEVQKAKILLFLKLDPTQVKGLEGISRNVSNIGHFGTGDLEIAIKSNEDLDNAAPFIKLAYRKIGG